MRLNDSPIIFIGMHRSGTSMLGQILERLGLFSGKRKDENNESIFFQRLNGWIMHQCGARWDTPNAMQFLWGNERLLNWIEDYIRYYLNSPRLIQYIGFKAYLFKASEVSPNFPWGWKDPCNTFTLPFWLRIFPKAKIVYIERHGVDVAKSLLVRNEKGFFNAVQKYKKYKPIVFIRPKRRGFLESPRCSSLDGALSLWEEYIGQAIVNLQTIPSSRILTLRYEDILKDPTTQIDLAANFCELNPSNDEIIASTNDIKSENAHSYLKNEHLLNFAKKNKETLNKYGYKCV